MKTLICTPAYSGQVTTKYFNSMLIEGFLAPGRLENLRKYEIGSFIISNESLISRGRNHCVAQALKMNVNRILFIDADVGFKWLQLKSILDSSEPIIAGLCPLKSYPLNLNFLPFKDDEQYFFETQRTPEGLERLAVAQGTRTPTVAFVGTAFMQIDLSVFKQILKLKLVGRYMYPDHDTGQATLNHDFFPCGPIEERYMSEDWGFCHLARQAGFEIKIHSDVIVSHTGGHTFESGSKVDIATSLEKLNHGAISEDLGHADDGVQMELPVNE